MRVCVCAVVSYQVVLRSRCFISLTRNIWSNLATMFLIIEWTQTPHWEAPLEEMESIDLPVMSQGKAANRWVTIEIQQKTVAMPIRCLQSAGMCKCVDADSEKNKTATIFMLLVIAHWDFCRAPLPHSNPGYADVVWHGSPQARLLMWSTSDTGSSDNRQEIKDTVPLFAKKKPPDTPKVWTMGPICCQLSLFCLHFVSPHQIQVSFLWALLNLTDLYKN